MAQITITKVKKDWVNVVINPSINQTKQLLINHEINVARVRLLDAPETADIIKVYMVDKDVLELHYLAGVDVSGTLATSNQHLFDLLTDLFTSI
jgi:hypothetical protein